MLDFSKVKFAATNWTKNLFNKSILNLSSCKHTFKFIDQVWDRVGTKSFRLKNRFGCSKCQGMYLTELGE